LQVFLSDLDDNKTLVLHVERGDCGPAVDLLETRGYGYAVFGDDVDVPFAVVDYRLLDQPEFTKDHMLAIEAHELGHIHEESEDEPTADRIGITLLEKAGLMGAAELLRNRGIA